MNERLERARRTLAIQIAFDRRAAWRLIEIGREDGVLGDQRQALVGFLETESAFAAPFAAAMMRRLQRLEQNQANLNAEKQTQENLRLEERRRLRRAQQIVHALADEAQRLEDQRDLFAAIEAAAGQRVT